MKDYKRLDSIDVNNLQKLTMHLDMIRANKRIKMKDLSEKSGIERCSLRMILNGDQNPKFTSFVKIVNALGYSVEIKPRNLI